MKRNDLLKVLLGAILAGICIGIGGTVYLSVDNAVVGSLLFATGLYSICVHGLYLYTGKIGYLPTEAPEYLFTLAITWLGNYIGTLLAALFVNATRFGPALRQRAMQICAVKTGDDPVSLFALGLFCGLLMFIAVDGYAKLRNPIILFACISTFILCGFEHCVADMFYFCLSESHGISAAITILSVTCGNTVGAIMIPIWREYCANSETA